MDRLREVVSALLSDVECPLESSVVPLHLLVWVDGTKTGSRPLVAAKVRLLDPQRILWAYGVSPIARWMECFYPEGDLPLFLRHEMLQEINTVRDSHFTVGVAESTFNA